MFVSDRKSRDSITCHRPDKDRIHIKKFVSFNKNKKRNKQTKNGVAVRQNLKLNEPEFYTIIHDVILKSIACPRGGFYFYFFFFYSSIV